MPRTPIDPDINAKLPYAENAVVALKKRLDPADADDALVQYLVTKCGHDELTARYAAAGQRYIEARKEPLTEYQRRILRHVDRGNYYRVTGGWRSLPVMGKQLPLITVKTASPLLHARYMEMRGTTLRLTSKGKELVR